MEPIGLTDFATPAASLGALAALLLVLLLGVARSLQGRNRLETRIASVRPGASAKPAGQHAPFLTRATIGLGEAVRNAKLLSPKTLAGFEASMATIGLQGPRALALYIGIKLCSLVALPLLGLLLAEWRDVSPQGRLLYVGGAGVLGILGPDWVFGRLRRRYVGRVEDGLSDALDLMVICAEAGLGLDVSMERVAFEMRRSNPALANEFAVTVSEMRILPDRRLALSSLGERTGIEGLKRLGATLAQTLQYGTPLTQALRVLAAELRQQRLTRFEERAARMPVLLTLPMILFILPCVFLVVGGPAVLRMLDVMGNR